ncbi:MAG: ankyrin repeat domain-containing protein [Mucilaginibacter sp.]
MTNINDFFDLVERNDVKKVQELINNGIDINRKDKFGYSAIHTTMVKNLPDMAKILIDGSINLNLQNNEGITSLHCAAIYNNFSLADLLLRHGADLSIEDKYGNQPLWTATFNDKGRNERREMIKLFLKNGADVNHKNNVGKSPKDIVLIAGYKNLEDIIF